VLDFDSCVWSTEIGVDVEHVIIRMYTIYVNCLTQRYQHHHGRHDQAPTVLTISINIELEETSQQVWEQQSR
jgi:hypothetical protein